MIKIKNKVRNKKKEMKISIITILGWSKSHIVSIIFDILFFAIIIILSIYFTPKTKDLIKQFKEWRW